MTSPSPRTLLLSALILLPLELIAQTTAPAACQPSPTCQVPGQASSAQTPAVARSLTSQAPRPPRVIVTDLSAFHLQQKPAATQATGGSRGNDSTLILCAPPKATTSNPHPLFVWRGGGGRVTFDLLDDKGEVLEEIDGSGNSLRYPDSATPLVQGRDYAWKVTGGSGNMNELPPAVTFKLATAPPADQLKQAAQDPLALAQLYIRAGLWYDSVATLEEALQADPANKDLSAQLTALYKAITPACPAP